MTREQEIVTDMMVTLGRPPVILDSVYGLRVKRTADFVGEEVFVSGGEGLAQDIVDGTLSLEERNAVYQARNAVVDRIVSLTDNMPPSAFEDPRIVGRQNPFSVVAGLVVAPDEETSSRLVTDMTVYLELSTGSTTVSSGRMAQISSARVEVLTDGDFRESVISSISAPSDVQSAFDFSRRKPSIVFTADYSPDGIDRGCVVGWKRMADASGYTLIRKDFFTGEEVSFSFTNSELDLQKKSLEKYVEDWVLNFYDTDVKWYATVDPSPARHRQYQYFVRAYQNVARDRDGLVFSLETKLASIPPAQRARIRIAMADVAIPRGAELFDTEQLIDQLNPYPFVSQAIYGTQNYDWVIAGVNRRAAIDRGEPSDVVSSYSYVSSKISFLFAQADAGKLVVPQRMDDVVANVGTSISTHGALQVVEDVLKDTGIIAFLDGGFAKKDGVLSVVIRSIDTDNATVDVRSLMSDLDALVRGGGGGTFSGRQAVFLGGRVQEIDVPESNVVDDEFSEDVTQFADFRKNQQADVTTFEGLSSFVRAFRIVTDREQSTSAVSVPTSTRDVTEDVPTVRALGPSSLNVSVEDE